MKGILIDENGDMMVQAGSTVLGRINAQCAELIIGAYQGEFKAAPLLGGNIKRMLNGTPDPFWVGNIRSQLRSQNVKANVSADGNREVIVEIRK
jgi:hypothetical protein